MTVDIKGGIVGQSIVDGRCRGFIGMFIPLRLFSEIVHESRYTGIFGFGLLLLLQMSCSRCRAKRSVQGMLAMMMRKRLIERISP